MARQHILTLTEGQLAELQQQRIHHEHPRVRQRMDAVWLRANGMTQLRELWRVLKPGGLFVGSVL